MIFQTAPIDFSSELIPEINLIRRELLGLDPPHLLYHYTDFKGVMGIIASRSFWANCVTNLADKTEIFHGCNLLREVIADEKKKKVARFSELVLDRLPAMVERRIDNTFVTCFCAKGDSAHHWREYGDYCLCLETSNRQPLLAPASSSIYSQYHRVTYGEVRQRVALQRAITVAISALAHSTAGQAEGPWILSLAQWFARNAAELLLDLIVAFKDVRFAKDCEWRLVCRPRQPQFSSAPDYVDRDFQVFANPNPRKHLDLTMPREEPIPFIYLRPPIPFIKIEASPYHQNRAYECRKIKEKIQQNGADIPVIADNHVGSRFL